MAPDTFSNPGQVAILATAFAGLVTTLATLLYQFVREGRRHRWEVEAARMVMDAAKKVETESKEIAAKVEKAEVKLNAKIDENTALSRQAFSEANHVNQKLADQSAAFDKLLQTALTAGGGGTTGEPVGSAEAIDAVQTTVDKTAGKVTDIHKRVVENG